ncbi:MAG: GNAT family N-acetyltransferase [Quinella sp. 1Q7]|nr:GNAT family N-acetyltransferase [Quinella sp. 1Q7]
MEIVDGGNYLDAIKRLVTEYTKFLGRDLSFQHLDDELNDLSAKYTPPEGRILCARVDGEIIGCVAYHRHNAARCEMKRLFVRAGFREHHAGSQLVEAIINSARADGFREMVLDTITPLKSAIRLYKKFGFVECAPYYENPMSDVIYMKKILTAGMYSADNGVSQNIHEAIK